LTEHEFWMLFRAALLQLLNVIERGKLDMDYTTADMRQDNRPKHHDNRPLDNKFAIYIDE